MQFINKDRQPTVRRPSTLTTWGTALAMALTAQAGPLRSDASAQATSGERVTARGVLAADSLNPLVLRSLGENPVAERLGAPITVNEISRTRELFAATTADWAEEGQENMLRLLNGYREGSDVSDAAIISAVRARIASAAVVGGAPQEVAINDLLRANGYELEEGVEYYAQTVDSGEATFYAAGTQGDGIDGAKLIDLGGHDSIAVRGDGRGGALGVRIGQRRTVRAGGEVRVENEAWDAADGCGNAFDVLNPETTTTVENPCPPRINVPVEGLPEGSLVTVVFAFEDGERPIPTVDNDTCPTSSLPEVCRDCTAGVARAAELELEERYNKEYGVLTAGTTRVMGGEIHIDIPPVYRVQLETDEIINIDVRRALDNETLLMYISCPREERGRREIGEGHSATLRRSDWAQAERAADGSLTLPLEFRQRQGVYTLDND